MPSSPASAQERTCRYVEIEVESLSQNLGWVEITIMLRVGQGYEPIHLSRIYLNAGEIVTISQVIIRDYSFSVDGAVSVSQHGVIVYPPTEDTTHPACNIPTNDGAFQSVAVAGIYDGRINDGPDELGAPLAAYCSADGIIIWDIGANGKGENGFIVNTADITQGLENAVTTGQNTLIAEAFGNSLYALTSNELSFVSTDLKEPHKQYQFIAPADICG